MKKQNNEINSLKRNQIQIIIIFLQANSGKSVKSVIISLIFSLLAASFFNLSKKTKQTKNIVIRLNSINKGDSQHYSNSFKFLSSILTEILREDSFKMFPKECDNNFRGGRTLQRD